MTPRPGGPFSAAPELHVASPDGARIAVFGVVPATLGARGSPGDAGRDGGPPLLLVHGAAADHTTFRVLGPLLARSRAVFAIDRRGRGASTDGPARDVAGGYSIDLEFDDVAAVATALADPDRGAGRVDVFGHSYGGRAALGAALRTTAIRRLVAYEGAPVPAPVSYRPAGLVEEMEALIEAGDDAGALDAFLARAVGMSAAALADYHANPVWAARVAAVRTVVREVLAEDAPEASLAALAGVAIPVLLVCGSISHPPFRLGTEALAARLAQVEVAVIEGAAHAAHHSHAVELASIVERFLDT